MSIKILIVEDHTIIRSGLRSILEQLDDIQVVAEAADGKQAIEQARNHSPDIVLMDVMLRNSELSGLQATEKISKTHPKMKIIALSVMEELTFVKAMLTAGASGYLYKDCTEDELMEAIQAVMTGQNYFSPGAAKFINEDYVRLMKKKGENENLTVREFETLQQLASGKPSKSIAADLNISRKTVDAHKRNIMRKLNIWSIAELTQYAMRQGIVSDEKF